MGSAHGGRAGADFRLVGHAGLLIEKERFFNFFKYNRHFNKDRLQPLTMDFGAIIGDSIDYTREALAGRWISWLIFIICTLPMALIPFVFDPNTLVDKASATIHWELIPWPQIVLLLLAGFLLSFITAGYFVRVYRGTSPPPVFDQWGSLYIDGIKLVIVGILWFIPAVIVAAAALGLLLLGFVSSSPSIGLLLSALFLLFISLAIVIITCLYSSLGCIRFARTGSIREGIRFSAINETIRTMGWGTYLFALLVLFAVTIVFSIIAGVLSIIPFVGWVIDLAFNALLSVFLARYMSRVYDHGVNQSSAAVPETAVIFPVSGRSDRTDDESGSARLRTYLFEPETFFRNLTGQPPRYRGPLVIVLVAGIITAISTWITMSWLFSSFLPGLSGMGPEYGFMSILFGIMVAFAAVCAIFGPLAIAIVAGLVFYILAGFFSKGGSLLHTITYAAWGIVPLAVYDLLQIPLFLSLQPGMSITVSPEFYTMIKNSTSASGMDKEVMMHMIIFNQPFYTYAMVSAGLHILAWLCCAWFWIPAVRASCGLEQRQAALIVLVPLLVYLAVTFIPILVTGGHVV
jgi:hypothetical protein